MRSNAETVKLLNTPINNLTRNVFCREGAFCSYRIFEKLFPELKNEKPVINDKINPKYSLIRLSGGLTTTKEDIYYAYEKLKAINRL